MRAPTIIGVSLPGSMSDGVSLNVATAFNGFCSVSTEKGTARRVGQAVATAAPATGFFTPAATMRAKSNRPHSPFSIIFLTE
jgi:hypothetical protein